VSSRDETGYNSRERWLEGERVDGEVSPGGDLNTPRWPALQECPFCPASFVLRPFHSQTTLSAFLLFQFGRWLRSTMSLDCLEVHHCSVSWACSLTLVNRPVPSQGQ
jgi:hypothetical protein